MKISREHKLYRYCYLFCDNKPWRTSLCKMFWAFWFTTSLLCIITGLVSALLIILYLVAPFDYRGFVYTVIGTVVVSYYVAKWICERYDTTVGGILQRLAWKLFGDGGTVTKTFDKIEASLFWKMMKSIKAKTCPIIEVEY